jgi:WW domain-containing oxidoreductase
MAKRKAAAASKADKTQTKAATQSAKSPGLTPGRLVLLILAAYLAYDHYTSESSASHLDGIAEVFSLTADAAQGSCPACTLNGNGYMYSMLFAEALTKNKESAVEIAAAHASNSGVSLAEQVIIITGSSNGIGRETARVLMLHGAHVVFAVRNKTKGEKVAKEIASEHGNSTVIACDLSSLASVKSFVSEFEATGLPLHQLINNAGIMMTPTFETTAEGFELQWGVDYLGHFLLTLLLMPKLHAAGTAENPARVINLASTAHYTADSFDPIRDLPPKKAQYNAACNYGMAKMCNLLFTRELQQQMKQETKKRKKDEATYVTAVAVHPGLIHTGLGRENKGFTKLFFESGIVSPMLKTVAQGAATTVHCAMAPNLHKKVADGTVAYSDLKKWDIHPTGMDTKKARDLWRLSLDSVISFVDPFDPFIRKARLL